MAIPHTSLSHDCLVEDVWIYKIMWNTICILISHFCIYAEKSSLTTLQEKLLETYVVFQEPYIQNYRIFIDNSLKIDWFTN